MKKISPQMKINIMTAAGVIVFLLLWTSLYLPARREIRGLKKELDIVQGQIHQIEDKVGGRGEMSKGIRLLEKQFREIDSKFPQKEEQALKMILDLAKQFNTEVGSVKAQAKVFFLDEASQKVEVGGKFCKKLPVSMEIKATYKDLVAYIGGLKELLPAYVTIENLEVRKAASGSLKLDVKLDVNLYLLS